MASQSSSFFFFRHDGPDGNRLQFTSFAMVAIDDQGRVFVADDHGLHQFVSTLRCVVAPASYLLPDRD